MGRTRSGPVVNDPGFGFGFAVSLLLVMSLLLAARTAPQLNDILVSLFVLTALVHVWFSTYLGGPFGALRIATWAALIAFCTASTAVVFLATLIVFPPSAPSGFLSDASVALRSPGGLPGWPVVLGMGLLVADLVAMYGPRWWRASVKLAAVIVAVWAVALLPYALDFPEVGAIEPPPPTAVLPKAASILPEWYLLPVYEVLRVLPTKSGGLAAAVVSLLLPLSLPWLRTDLLRARLPAVWLTACLGLVVGWTSLASLAAEPIDGACRRMAGIGLTLWLVAFFTVLPPVLHRAIRQRDAAQSASAALSA